MFKINFIGEKFLVSRNRFLKQVTKLQFWPNIIGCKFRPGTIVTIRGIRDTSAVVSLYTHDTRKRFDALGREVCSRRRAPCQEADIAANETPRSVFVCMYVCGVRPAHCPTVSFRRKVMQN